ncbi:EPD protein, partial [Amia calva]|nr:EPD protein [Amia calva]
MDAKFVQVVSGIFSYDGLGQKFRIRENFSVAGSSFALDTLFLFREHIQYKIFYQNQTCVRSPLDTRFRPLEVPPDAQFLTQMVVGGSSQPGEGVLGNQWTGKIPETKGTYYTLVSEFGCLPLSDLYYDAHGLWITT